eukprot:Skav230509  [mRNA]  locus=scaffold2083:247920:257401:+ [translate_table: standard]
MKLHVSLPSGRFASVELPLIGTVGDLKVAAQQSLGQRFLRLMGPDGTLLSPVDSLRHALQDGDDISAIAQQPKLAATNGAFALWYVGSDRIVTWGAHRACGDSAEVRDQLRNVQQIHARAKAFAAVLADGSVVTWGHRHWGGDSSRAPLSQQIVEGLFSPIVTLGYFLVGQTFVERVRGKGIELHSRAITAYCNTFGIQNKKRQGFIKTAKKTGHDLGMLTEGGIFGLASKRWNGIKTRASAGCEGTRRHELLMRMGGAEDVHRVTLCCWETPSRSDLEKHSCHPVHLSTST